MVNLIKKNYKHNKQQCHDNQMWVGGYNWSMLELCRSGTNSHIFLVVRESGSGAIHLVQMRMDGDKSMVSGNIHLTTITSHLSRQSGNCHIRNVTNCMPTLPSLLLVLLLN
jgi:hypothetical protein